jgi:hypothetical protein
MPKYVIEREIPGAGELTAEQLKAMSQRSCEVLSRMGSQIHWIESYVTADKLYCIYIATSKALIEEHARQGGFPVNSIAEVLSVVKPSTAEVTLG